MIIQCEQCQTRFRLADEKLKPTGTKVRCSKCKYVFTVMPPEPEPPEEEAVDFDAMNMEAVGEPPPSEPAGPRGEETSARDTAAETGTDQTESDPDFSEPQNEQTAPASSAGAGETTDQTSWHDPAAAEDDPGEEGDTGTKDEQSESEQDFSGLQQETAVPTSREGEWAEDFSFGGSAPAEKPDEAGFTGDATDETVDGGAGQQSEKETETFDFGEFPTEDEAGQFSQAAPEDFSLDSADSLSTPEEELAPGESAETEDFTFSEAGDDAEEFQFAMPGPDSSDSKEDEFGMGSGVAEFSFDEETTFEEEETDQWQEESSDEDSFDFDEPDFGPAADEGDVDKESFAFEEPGQNVAPTGDESASDNLQFGEIDLQADDDSEDSQTLETDSDFTGAGFSEESSFEEEAEAFSQEDRDQQRTRQSNEEKPLAAPPAKRKGPFAKVLLLLFLLLLVLGGAAGYFYLQDGALNFERIMERVTGQAQPAEAEHKININITETGYVNNNLAGQLLVVQGQATNNYPSARSAITIKGILLNDKGESIYQQTVFCGNSLDETTLRQASYAKIEEAMNNQFGDSLSNMDVAAGASIPFTIVFRNLPENIANINVEVVGSKPGSS